MQQEVGPQTIDLPNAGARRLHVLMVLDAHTYPAKAGGGAEAQVRALCRGLRERGHLATVIVPRTQASSRSCVERVDGVPLCRIAYPHVRLLGGLLLWLRLAAFLLQRRRRYDAWHVHVAHHLGAVTAVVGKLTGTRTLLKVSGLWEIDRGALALRRPPWATAAFALLCMADGWQAISQSIAQRLRQHSVPEQRIIQIPNAVDTLRFSGVHPDQGADARFVFLGRLVREKGLDTLLTAFADASRDFPRAHLTLAGAGRMEGELRRMVRELGIEQRVHFAGHRSDIEQVLADGNIGVLSSLSEGLSNTLLESMASGLPMIATRISGNEDFVVHGHNGWLVDPGDREGLAACLRQACALSVAERSAMGTHARETVERYAGMDHVLSRLIEFYRGERPGFGDEPAEGDHGEDYAANLYARRRV